MPIQVIVAGLPRTGTSSIHDALEQLGFNKTMHMSSCMNDPRLCAMWKEIYGNHLEKSWTNDDWRHIFDEQFPEYMATTLPASDFAVELARAYPEAKIILLYRDPDTWLKSFQHVVTNSQEFYHRIILWSLKNLQPFFQMRDYRRIWWRDIYTQDIDKEFMSFYVNKIRTSIAAERILEYKIQDGWAPLCKFLNKEVPLEAFPRRNDLKEFEEVKQRFIHEAMAIWLKWIKQAVIGTTILVVSVSVYWHRRFFFSKT